MGLQIAPGVDDEVPLSGAGGEVGHRCRKLLHEIAISKEALIYAGSINRDHVHMLIGIPPQLSLSRALRYLKGKSSHRLLSEYKALHKRYWGQHLWVRGCWVATSGNVTDEVWKEYIKNQQPPEPDGDFTVVKRRLSAEWPINPAFSRNPMPPALAGGVFTYYEPVRQ